MRKNENVNPCEKVNEVLQELEKFINAEVIVGKPIKVDDTTIIPLCDVTFGLGFGFNGMNSSTMQGGGVGGSITPNSLLIIENGTSKLVSIKDSNSIAQLIPQIMDRLNLDIIKKPGSSNKQVRFESDED